MNPVLPFAGTVVLGVVALVAATNVRRWSPWEVPLFIVATFLIAGSVIGIAITASVESNKNRCLKTLPAISQRETKWLDGECYMKAKDGKFVPQEWIEKGYER